MVRVKQEVTACPALLAACHQDQQALLQGNLLMGEPNACTKACVQDANRQALGMKPL